MIIICITRIKIRFSNAQFSFNMLDLDVYNRDQDLDLDFAAFQHDSFAVKESDLKL